MKANLRSFVHQHLPITEWLPKYSVKDAVSDIVGGLTVGIVMVPQAIAFADLAGLGPQYGLYSAWVNGLIHAVFGTTKEMSIGPTAVHSLLVFTYTHHLNADMAVFLCFASGCVLFLIGLFQLSFLVEFVSIPVISAFTTASALLLIATQLKGLFGLNYVSDTFVDSLLTFGSHISETRLWDIVLGATSIVILLALETLKCVDLSSGRENKSFKNRFINGTIWIIMIGRSGMVMFVAFIMAIVLHNNGETPFLFMDRIGSGLPTLRWPPTSTVVNGRQLDLLDMIRELWSGVAVITILTTVSSVAVAKTFSKGRGVDSNQETIAVGLCNILGSFAQSMPVAASVSRTGVAKTSGISSPLAGLHTSLVVIFSISFLASYFYYIPRSSISAVLIVSSIYMIDTRIIRKMWLLNKKDLLPYTVTVVVGLTFGVEKGIIFGILLDNLILLYFTARPEVHLHAVGSGTVHWVLQPRGPLMYPAANHVWDTVARLSTVDKDRRAVVLDCDYICHTDYTAAQGLNNTIKNAKAQGLMVVLLNADDRTIKSLCIDDKQVRVATSRQHLSQILAEVPTLSK
ncbi:sodium-independent sulfate anion transporter-like [Homalodisca vitripennis]|uniref:sodium-independent sulfate anion transporter-like n=1 Tax=Homalodisca vitripennis TaxID=197043 RepID=UPI001EEBF29D|nr:sodium-independent sulfate anion transporter-like [Homalodisca vitripennis]